MKESNNEDREKFTTTLTRKHKVRLAILAAYFEKSGKNTMIEDLIDEKWEWYQNEMANK